MDQDPWTPAVDAVLASVEGLPNRKAAKKLRVSFSTIQRWRELRERGENIPEPRGAPRDLLVRSMDQGEAASIDNVASVETADAGGLSAEAQAAYDFLATTLRAQRGRRPDADPGLIKDAIRGAIEEARARGWPLGPLYELLGRVESGDF